MSTNLKIKLVGVFTTIAMFALPIAGASATAAGAERTTMNTNLKLKLVGLFTTIAMLALPVAEASAYTRWC